MKPRTKQVFDEINITPLTDIFLVLLIIMMVVAPLLEYRQLDIALTPGGDVSTADDQDEAQVVQIFISADGRYTIGGKDVAPADLVAAIQSRPDKLKEGVYIETHPNANWEALAKAMDAAQAAKAVRIKIAESADDVPAPSPEPSGKPFPTR